LYPAALEGWSRRSSWLHHRDARAKLLATLALSIAIATSRVALASLLPYLALIVAGTLLARLPVAGLLARACIVLPFAGALALASLFANDVSIAAGLLAKSYLSAAAVLLLTGSTPMPVLLAGLGKLGAPRPVVLVIQFLYRYLFVIWERAARVRLALASRGGFPGLTDVRRARIAFQSGAGAVAALFGSSYRRAEGVHRAMLARGFQGRLPEPAAPALSPADALFVLAAASATVAIRLLWGSSP
jgi:cobalt/nickel transport system permease protein